MRALILALVATLAASGQGLAAQQHVLNKMFLVKNPASGARKVLWKVSDENPPRSVVGDPIAQGGATLHIMLSPGGDQCVTMPASGWSPIGSIGFKYKDSTLANGPVKVASIKETPSGTFKLKFLLKNGGPTPINVAPGDPTATWATNFTLGTGDEYCGGGPFAATPNPNNATTFKVGDDGAPGSCISTCSAPPTSTSSSTSTTSTTSTTILTVCGDTLVQGAEQCDDGNTMPNDGCDANCLIEETTSQGVGAGGTVSSGATATPADPLETAVTSPNAGTVTIQETSPPSPPPAGFEFRGQTSIITAPHATTSDNPLELVFLIDASQIRPGDTENTIQVFRSGILVQPCLGAPGTAVPEPCVGERTLLPGGDVLIRVFATHTSPWDFGYPLCGNGMLDGTETCDPPAGSCGGGQSCKVDCTCAAVCDCCAGSPGTLTISHGAAGGMCGSVLDNNGMTAFNLTCNTVYVGGGNTGIAPFEFPDGDLVLKVTSCDSAEERLTLGATTSLETGDVSTCTSAGCRLGGPIAVPNPSQTPTSACVIPSISQDLTGLASCGGVINQLGLPLVTEIFLTGDAVTSVAGLQACPLCSSGSCFGGPNNGMTCVAQNAATVPDYPTSSDCPPVASKSVGSIPFGATLTTGQVTWTATTATNDTSSTVTEQPRVFAGYCRDKAIPGAIGSFENPPHQCWENGVAVGTPCGTGGSTYETCQQRTEGAFGPNGGANRTISQTGLAPGCLADELPHAARVGGPFRLPPTYDATVDSFSNLPGPGTITVDGSMQLQ